MTIVVRQAVPQIRAGTRRVLRAGAHLRRRWVGLLALAAYLLGSLGVTRPGIPLTQTVTAGCCCPSADVQTGVCCCSGKVKLGACCSQTAAAPRSDDEKASAGPAGHDRPSSSCCSKPTGDDSVGLQFTACPCGPGAPDQFLLCGDPRLPVPGVTVSIAEEASRLPATSAAQCNAPAHEPPTPPPRLHSC